MNNGWQALFASILLLFASLLHAQTTFNKVIGLDTNSEFGSIVVKTDTGFLVTYGDKDQTLKTYCMGVLALNKKGTVLKKSRYCYGENKIVRYGRSLTLSNGNVAHYGTLQQYDTVKKDFTTWTALTMFTPMGDTLWTKQYLDSNRHVVARSLAETNDSGLWLIGDETINSSNRDPLIYKVDGFGNLISSHTLPHIGVGAIYSVVEHANGKYYVGGNAGDRQVPKIYIAELDSNMQATWIKYYPSGVGHAAFVAPSKDGSIIFGSDTLTSGHPSSIYTSRKQIFKIDTNGNIIWRKIHDEPGEANYYDKIIENSSGHLYVNGRKKPQEGIHYTLTKLTPDGDTIWMHRYAYENIEVINYLWDMVATEDGGVLMVGDVRPNGSRYQDVWLVKVDSNGCINNDCEKTLVYDMRVSVKESSNDIDNLSVFPNPSSGVFEINGLMPTEEYRFTIIDNLGQLILEESLVGNEIHAEQLTSGVYFLNVFENESLITTQKLIIHD